MLPQKDAVSEVPGSRWYLLLLQPTAKSDLCEAICWLSWCKEKKRMATKPKAILIDVASSGLTLGWVDTYFINPKIVA